MVTPAPELPVRPRVLVVDDDPGIRMAIRAILESEYTVTEAETIKQSLSIFDEQAQDLITLDIQMPEVDGMQGLTEFRRRSGKVPIILISGYRTFELAQEALRLGANDYLTKPFSVQELRDTIKSTLNKVCSDGDTDPSSNPIRDFMVRLSLEDLQDDRFLSGLHRSHFLAFAQNVLSKKKRSFELISVRELIKTITIQFDALGLTKDLDYKITSAAQTLRVECAMYLLGGALANLALTCKLETRSNKAPIEIVFSEAGPKLKVVYRKCEAHLSPKTVQTFTRWHQHPATNLDPNTAMLVLSEKVVRSHQGEFLVDAPLPPDVLVEISLPIHQPASS